MNCLRLARYLIVSLVIFSLSSLHGCAIIDNNSKPETLNAFYQPTCGPADGPAFEILISSSINSCRDTQNDLYLDPWQRTFTRIYIWRYPLAESLLTYYVGNSPAFESNVDGWAGVCEKGKTTCLEAESGVIRFSSPPRDEFEADIQLNYEDGTHFTQQVTVRNCPLIRPLLCG